MRKSYSITDVHEKIIGENTLRHIFLLELALESAKAVVHIDTSKGKGTGFMISPSLLMTNNHVIDSREIAEKSQFTFNYQLGRDGKEHPTQTVYALSGGEFYTNAELDYTVVTLPSPLIFGKPLNLVPKQMQRESRVSIIQHPGGSFKKISIQNNFIAYADTRIIQYTTSTLPGSSGSPVFDENFNVVAIHHSGGILIEPDTNQPYLRNEGTSMIAVCRDLKTNASNIYIQIENN